MKTRAGLFCSTCRKIIYGKWAEAPTAEKREEAAFQAADEAMKNHTKRCGKVIALRRPAREAA
ncbi:MAG: hypothetical protein WC801_01975 [Patescibacteria group bacterium]